MAAGCGDGLTLPGKGNPTRIVVVAGSGQSGAVGTVLPESVVVRVTDRDNQPVAGQRVSFGPASDAQGGSAAPDTALTDGGGRAAARWVLGPEPGVQLLDAQVVGIPPLRAQFQASAAQIQASSLLKLRGDGQTGVAGTALADSLVVRAVDARGQPVAGVAVTWAVGGGGAVSAPQTATGADGTAAVVRILGPAAGPQSTSALAGGLTGSPIVFAATAVNGAAGRLALATEPSSSAASGAPFARQPVVQLLDGNNNPVQQANIAVQASIAAAPPGGSATLIGSATASTDANGLATFTGLGIAGTAGSYTLAFSATGLAGTVSGTVQLGPGEPTALAIVTQPSDSALSGIPFPRQPVVVLRDGAGNQVPRNGVQVTASVAGGGATLDGTTGIATDATGAATFSDLSLSGQPGSYGLLFAGSSLASATSSPVVLTVAVSAARSTIAAPGQLTAGVSGTVTVTVNDSLGQPLAGVSVALSATGSGNLIQPATAITGADGAASFGFSSTVAEEKSLAATAGGVSIGPATTTVLAGPADPAQTVSTVPDGHVGQRTFVAVTAYDQYGNRALGGGARVAWVVSGANSSSGSKTLGSDGTTSFNYTPLFTGADSVAITLNGVPIKGSPYPSNVGL